MLVAGEINLFDEDEKNLRQKIIKKTKGMENVFAVAIPENGCENIDLYAIFELEPVACDLRTMEEPLSDFILSDDFEFFPTVFAYTKKFSKQKYLNKFLGAINESFVDFKKIIFVSFDEFDNILAAKEEKYNYISEAEKKVNLYLKFHKKGIIIASYKDMPLELIQSSYLTIDEFESENFSETERNEIFLIASQINEDYYIFIKANVEKLKEKDYYDFFLNLIFKLRNFVDINNICYISNE